MTTPRLPLRGLRGALTITSTPSPVRIHATQAHPPCQTQRAYHHPAPASAHANAVDQSEISHFTALASSWWDPHGPSRLLHLMNPLRHDFLARCRASAAPAPPRPQQQQQGLRYLDIGCGGGIFAESAARLPGTARVTGLDPTPAVLEVARTHALRDPALEGKLEYIGLDVGAFASAFSPTGRNGTTAGGEEEEEEEEEKGDARFDTVSLFEVLEHVPSPAGVLDAALPLLKPGGWLVGSTIARTWTSWVTTKVVAEDLLGLVPRGTHEWEKYVDVGELRGYLGHPDRRKVVSGEDGGPGWDAGSLVVMGVVYVPGLGWREVPGSEEFGNYFFGFRRGLEA